MGTLNETLCGPNNRPQVVQDAARLVDSEVSKRSGLSGMAIKAGYKAVCAIKPSLIPETVDGLLDRFVEQLEPFYATWSQGGKTVRFSQYLSQRQSEVANALLKVTDDRARHAENALIKKTYSKLRPMGEKQVSAAVPGLGQTLDRYVS